MVVLIGIQLFVIALFTLLGWAIRYKKVYELISGYAARSEEEKEELIRNGYPQKNGSLLLLTALGMLLLLPLALTHFRFTMEVQFGFMLIFLMGGMIYLSKYEVPRKRRRSYWISSILMAAVFALIGGITFIGYQKNELIVSKDSFQITGMYGDKWDKGKIETVELLDEMPEVTWKINGFGLSKKAKGVFKVKDYGRSLLFIKKESSYIYVKVKNQHLFINGGSPEETRLWYEELAD
ncbi:DUF3784 domain-containing protein [Rossellomorea aquimaris]|uniref:Bacterial Pleckstrin homology domain-containing protein n=1 Tax=Rossellomorea aquimaris TaxID=189382 RepID=A0A1J6WUB6_9BACI|nr:DUF3784 domain-containing protein [Rossellomorea aquimaris]OIU71819.1 hypothetical protein BHE18_03960 [Rossellomorea aquimaris]